MNDKNTKAKQYVENKKYAWDIEGLEDMLESEAYRDFKNGYSIGQSELQSTLTQYKEALRELVELAPVVIDPCVAETYFEALECRHKYILASEKAKQLLKSE